MRPGMYAASSEDGADGGVLPVCSPPPSTTTPHFLPPHPGAAWITSFDPLLEELSAASGAETDSSSLRAAELRGRRAESSAVYLQRDSSECQPMVLWVCAQRGKKAGVYICMRNALGSRGWECWWCWWWWEKGGGCLSRLPLLQIYSRRETGALKC